MPSRRQVLALFGGGVFVAAVGGLAWVASGYDLLPGEQPIGLTPEQFVVTRALAEALGAAGGPSPSELAQRVDEEVWSAPEAIAADLRAALLLLELAPPWFGFAGRLSALGLDARRACLRAMWAGDTDVIVQAVVAFKQMIHLFLYADPRTWEAIGYDGPWVAEGRPPPSALAYARLRT